MRPRVLGLDWCPISEGKALWLERPFEKELVVETNSPGPDGFSMMVFQDCWEIIFDDLTKVLMEFFNNGIVNVNTNATYICLISKNRILRKLRILGLLA